MDKRRQNEHPPWDDSAYGTGSTEPPRNNGSLVAILLILVICLAGLVSALSILNIRLFRELERQAQPATTPLSFFNQAEDILDPDLNIAVATAPRDYNDLGIAGEEVSPFYRRYYHFPKGLYITDVSPHSIADSLGLQPGDVLISINGTRITDSNALQSALNSYAAGDSISLVIYRGGKQYTLQLVLDEMEKSEK